MEYLNKNIEALQKKEGLDYYKLSNFLKEWKKDTNFFVELAKDGTELLGLYKDEKKVYLNSTYNPIREAEKFIEKIRLRDNSVIVFMGLGNGIIVRELIKVINDEAEVLIAIPSKDEFAFVMNHFDLSDILETEQVNLFVSEINDKYFDLSLTYCLQYLSIGVTIMESHPKYKELYKEEYVLLEKQFKDCRESALVNLKTVMERQTTMVENAIKNIPYLLSSRMTSDYMHIFPKNMPAIMVSGGPSLDKNYEMLKKAKGRALIIAVDRTAQYLLDRGIEPDMFCSLDFRKSLKLFQDERLKKIPFLYISDLNHNVLKTLGREHLIFGTTNSKFYNWLIAKCGKMGVDLALGGSVATLGFSFVKTIGIERLILVGQDLALTNGENYAGGMVCGVNVDNFDTMMVPGNVEEEILTRGDYYIYLKWFEQQIKEAKEESHVHFEVTNATEGGARILGTEVMSLEGAIDQYCKETYDVEKILKSVDVLVSKEKWQKVIDLLEKMKKGLSSLKEKAKEAENLSKRLGTLAERTDFGKEFKDKNARLKKITDLFDEKPEANLLSSYVEGILLKEDIDLYITEDDNQEEMLRLYHKLEKNYQLIYEHADTVIDLFQDMMEEMKEMK